MFGAICGDILGSTCEYDNIKYENPIDVPLFQESDTFTDDTAMTLAVADWLLNDIQKAYYDDDSLKQLLALRFVEYATQRFPGAHLGFGGRFWNWICKGELTGDFTPINSFGNGSGMRVSPVGFFFDTMEETMRFAKLSADVTHNHPEGQKDAMCIAAAIFLARKGYSKSEMKEYLLRAFGYEDLNKTVAELRAACKWSEICQDTVPMSVVAFLESDDFESAISLALSYGSDSDTIGDMTGAIAEAYYKGVPQHISDFCSKRLPEDVQRLCQQFYSKIDFE